MKHRNRLRLGAILAALPMALLAAGLAAGLAGCGTARPLRPYGNLGDAVNSPSDEFAPTLRPGRPGLYFTSNRVSSEDIWRAAVNDPAGPTPVFSLAGIDSSDISLLSRPSTNDGSVVFTTANTGLFASGHAPDTLFARDEGTYGGIIGGTDLFEFRFGAGGLEVRNLGAAINSVFWDSHPAAAIHGDSLLLIFSSDRPSNGAGFGSPYNGTVAMGAGGDSVRGNADLYYVFRVGGAWGPVRNFATAAGNPGVNSPANEYSPYLYCIDEHPRMLFSSNRNGSFDIWEADLNVDFAHQSIAVAGIAELPAGNDSINTSSSNELFPFMTPPASGGDGQYLYLASDRDSIGRTIGDKEMRSVGGYDLYRFPLTRECRPPQARYEVTVIDAEDPSRPVPMPVVRLYRTGGGSAQPAMPAESESATNPASFSVDFNSDYSVFGGSAYNEVHCDDHTRAIASYAFMRVRTLEPEIRRRLVTQWRDTIDGGRMVTVVDTTLRVDTIPLASAGSIASTPASMIRSVTPAGDRLIVTRANLAERRVMVGGSPAKFKAQVAVYDTITHIDTIMVPTTQNLAPSERVLRFGSIAVPKLRSDVVIRDTIYVHPQYYQAPPCEWIYTRSITDDYRKNVPYFQTAFWEVNTGENLKRDLKLLGSEQMADAGFVELHPSNLYFGVSTGRRPDRIDDYTAFARMVDSNLAAMAGQLAGQIIPEFMAFDAKTPGSNNKLVIQIEAYSDVRPISRGYYAGTERVNYVAGGYDAASGKLRLYNVAIAPGASIVSENNDTLSKLRVFFGYRELIKRMEQYPAFKQLVDNGTILLPASGIAADAFQGKAANAKIIIVMEGKNADRSAQPSTSGYTGHRNDFYSLDDVRRMDVQVNRLEYINGRLVKSPCCTEQR